MRSERSRAFIIGHERALRVPSTLDRQGSMELQDTEGIVSIGGRSWRFSGAQIDPDSEFEWRGGKLYLHDGAAESQSFT
jgi:hypothetical protein